MKPTTAFRISAALGFLGVALGAFGAHALHGKLALLQTEEIWKTASFYHLLHAVTLVMVAREFAARKTAWWAFSMGILIFSGSLYAYALTGVKALGMITPFGGLGFLIGWGALIFGPAMTATKNPVPR